MTITPTNNLSDQQLSAVKTFIKHCRQHDLTYREPYLSNILNFDHDMPCFFLAYKGEELVGLLTVYADTPDVELTLTIAPAYRQQGYAKRLFDSFLETTKPYQVTSYSFIIEKHFLNQNPDLLESWQLDIDDEDREIWLGRPRSPLPISDRDVDIIQAQEADATAIAHFQAETFDNPFEVSYRYALEAIKDEHSLLYALNRNGQCLASCTVDLSSDVNYLYGLAVRKDMRGQGLGSHLVSHIVNDLIKQNNNTFQIAVEVDNLGARRLYEKLGFSYQTEVLYLNPKS